MRITLCTVVSLCFACGLSSYSVGSRVIGIYAGIDRNTIDNARESGVDVIYPSLTAGLRSSQDPFPDVSSQISYARSNGIKIYPSIAVGYDGPNMDNCSVFAKANPQFLEKRKDGRIMNDSPVHLSWGFPEVREYKVTAIVDFVKVNRPDGVLLDYIRYFGRETGYSEVIVEEFKERFGTDPYDLPIDDPQWIAWRKAYLTKFMRELRSALKKVDDTLEIIVCVGPDEEWRSNVMSDWLTWVKEDLVDGVVTMLYERDTNNTLRQVIEVNNAIEGRVPHVPMIACWGGNLETPDMLKEGASKCLKAGSGGVAFYRSDAIYTLDLWPTIRDISQWHPDFINAEPINYLMNSSFENGLAFYAVGTGKGLELVEAPVYSGKHSLGLEAGHSPEIKQMVDRGFVSGLSAVKVGGFFYRKPSESTIQAEFLIDIFYTDGTERLCRIPAEIVPAYHWQNINAVIDVQPEKDIQWIIWSFKVQEGSGTVYADNVYLNVTQKPAHSDKIVFERSVQAVDTNGLVNLVRGQIVQASSFWEPGYEPANAVNGNFSSENHGKSAAWHSQRPPRNQWLRIHLPQTHIIRKFRILNSSAQFCYRTKDFRIEISANSMDWVEVAQGTLPNDGETWTEIEITPISARFIKFTGLNSFHPDYSVGLKEIEVY